MFDTAIDTPRSAPEQFTRHVLASLTGRLTTRCLLVEFNPHQVLVAEVSRSAQGPVVVTAAMEFARDDEAGVTEWLEERPLIPIICGLVPNRMIVHRQSLQPPRLAEPDYLADVVEEHQRGRFLTSTPFKVLHPEKWSLRAVNAVDGRPLPAGGPAQPGLICGIANDDIRDWQKRLHLPPERIEAGVMSLFAALYSNMERRGGVHPVAIVVVQQTATNVYILGKDGVHAPTPVLHGFVSIVEAARKELGLDDHAEVRHHLEEPHPLLRKHADKLVRRIGRDLKPVVDSYEMTTGEPVDEIFCAYLPPTLEWLATPLAKVTGRTAMEIDCHAWLETADLRLGDDGPAPGPHWLGALGLIAHLPPRLLRRFDPVNGEDPSYDRAWHVDYRDRAPAAERQAAGRRLLRAVVACALVVLAMVVAAWQLYASRSLQADLRSWQKDMAGNEKLLTELTSASAGLQAHSSTVQQAYDLMRAPYQLSEFFLNVGRTIPPHMRIDRIDTNDTHAAISGVLLQSAEDATDTLGRYLDSLRRNAGIGPLFSSITITSLERRSQSGAVAFEIVLRNNRPAVP